MSNRTPNDHADHGRTEPTTHAHTAGDERPQHRDHADTSLRESRALERAQEELGAAATHGHQTMVHAEHGRRDGHRADHGAHEGEHAAQGGGHAGHGEEMFQRPFWVALVLTVPVLIYAEHIQSLLGYTAPAFPGSRWLEPLLASVIYWYGGWVFLSGAVAELRARRPGMMTLVSLAITTAYVYSLAVTFDLVEGMAFYWELATLVTIMLLGHWLEMRAVGSAQNALSELAKLLPDMAERIADGGTEPVPVADLRSGDLVLVRPGGQVPADGAVEDGHSQVNESMITVESRPVEKTPGTEVIAGTVNGSGSLRVRVTRTGEETALAGIMRLVAEAQTSRTRAQALADRAAYWLTLVAVGAALVALVGWTVARGLDAFTIERVVTTLVVACPHALGLAIPLVIAISTTLSARNGILVRDRLALEEARNLNVVVFDKTGTLTRGEQGLVDLAVAVTEAARRLSLGRATTYLLVQRGELPVVRIGRAVRVPARALEQWVRQHTTVETT